MVKFQINKKFLPLKAHYFFYNAATGPVVPFMPTLGKQLGFSAGTMGLIYTCLPVFGLFAKTGFGALADRYKIQKIIFLFFQIFTALAFFGIMFIPEKPLVATKFECGGVDSEFEKCSTHLNRELAKNIFATYQNETMSCQLKCNVTSPSMWDTICEYWNSTKYCEHVQGVPETFTFNSISPISLSDQIGQCIYFRVTQIHYPDDWLTELHTPFCPLEDARNMSRHMSTTCETVCNIPEVNELLAAPEDQETSVFVSYRFWTFFMLLALSWVGMAVVVSVGDAVCFEMLEDKPNLYGHQRLWGSVGWGLFAFSAGFLVDYFSNGAMVKNYSIVFYIMLVMVSLDIFSSTKLQYNQSKLSVSILHDVGKLLTEVRVFVFLLWCISIGMCTGLIWNFLFWYLEDLSNNTNPYSPDGEDRTKSLEGILMGIQCFGGELPFFFLSSFILKKLGHINTMNLVLVGLGTRLILYSTLTSPWYAMPIELLHGVSYGVFYATMASYASIVAPLGTETTIQGLVGALFEIGVAIGSLIAGKCMDTFGGALTFRFYGIGCFIVLIIHVIIQKSLQRGRRFSTVIDDKDYDVMQARYATPGDAMHMIDDQQDIQLVEVHKNNNYHILNDVFS